MEVAELWSSLGHNGGNDVLGPEDSRKGRKCLQGGEDILSFAQD